MWGLFCTLNSRKPSYKPISFKMLKFSLLTLILLYGFSVHAEPTFICETDDDDLAKISNAVCVFNKPLLVGASLTQGQGANSGGPSILIAESLSPGAKPVGDFSQGGATSVTSLKNKLTTETPSIVIGIDLFFWDAAKKECGPDFDKSARDFITKYQDQNIPMILGKLPKGIAFPPGYAVLNDNDCTETINKLLDEVCTKEKNCLIYDPKDCLSKMEPENRKLYFVDSKHTSVEGNKFCAKEFVASSKYQDLKCKAAD